MPTPSETATQVGSRRRLGYTAAGAALVVSVLLSIAVGSNALTPVDFWHALVTPDASPADVVVLELRMPRTLAGLVAGIGLGLSGALIQAFTRNPLGDPGILGVESGAALSVAIGVALGASTPVQYVPLAFVGALVATIVVTVIGSSGAFGRGPDPVRLVLTGAALAAVLAGITTALILIDPVTFAQMRSWNAGSLVERGYDVILPTLPFVAVGILLALVCARALGAMALGDDLAAALGTDLRRTRILTILAVTLLAGSATAIAGPVAFVGLAVPHMARWFVGPDQRRIFLLSTIFAPVLLLLSDVLGRVALWPGEIPVGVVTAFVGAPVLIHLVRRSRVAGL